MSYYYSYYVGYIKDGIHHFLGPYDSQGNIKPVICKSRSFASDLHEDFLIMKEEDAGDDVKKELMEESFMGDMRLNARYLKLADLPTGDFVKTGYYLIDAVKSYEESQDEEDLRYGYITPTVYNAMAANEVKFGKPAPKKDVEGEEYVPYTASDYMYYAATFYNSKEFEAFMLREVAEMLRGYDFPGEDATLTIIETEG